MSPPFASPGLSKAAALLLLLATAALVWFGVVAPVQRAFAELAEERAALIQLRDRYARAAAGLDALEARRRAALAELEATPGLIEAPSAAAAAAEMQALLRGAVQAVDGDLRRVVVKPEEAGEGVERIGLRALATLDVEGLRNLLVALELENGQLRVGDLRVQATRGRADAATPLIVRFDLYGFRRLEGAAGPGPRAAGPEGRRTGAPGPALRRAGDG